MKSILTIDPARKTGIAYCLRSPNHGWSAYEVETIDLTKVSGSGLTFVSFRSELIDKIGFYHPDFIAFEMPTPRSMPAGRLQLGFAAIIQELAEGFKISHGWCLPNDIKKFHLGKAAYKKGSKDQLFDVIRRRLAVGENTDETDALALLDLIVQTQATGEHTKWLKVRDIK